MRRSNSTYPTTARRFVIIGFFLVLIVGYTLFEARRFIEGPQITIEYPPPGVFHGDRLIELRAKTNNISSITLNGREVFITENGILKEQLLLPHGYTILTIAAKDRFGHSISKELELYTLEDI